MTGPVTRARGSAAWVLLSVSTTTILVAATWLSLASTSGPRALELFSGSLVWVVLAPLSCLVGLAGATWMRFRADPRPARWIAAASLTLALYDLGSGASAWLADREPGSPALTAALIVAGNGWVVVLALLQAASLSTGEAALGRPFGRRGRMAITIAAAVVFVVGALVPPSSLYDSLPWIPGLLPRDVVLDAAVQTTMLVALFAWMASLFVTPIVLWVRVLRTRERGSRVISRVAIATLLPGVVIMLCGMLGGIAAAEGGDTLEVSSLALGFTLAFVGTVIWLAATLRDATAAAPAAVTAMPNLVRVLLWVLFCLAIPQIATLIAATLGGGAALGAATATVLIAATIVPWGILVRRVVRLVDPRASIAAAVIADGAGTPAAQLAERALRDALGVDGRLLLARPGGRWIDAGGADASAPDRRGGPDSPPLLEIGSGGMAPLAVFVHRQRFVRTSSIATAVRPLVERASLETDVREHAERAAVERRRADEAATDARLRLERDLHDGVQGRLVSLGLELGMAREFVDPMSAGILDDTIANLQSAVIELRELSSGVLSQRLAGAGLASAVADLTTRLPLTVELDIRPPVLSTATETTAYFVIAEALTNVMKHARAGQVTVAVTGDADVLVEIADDGAGGADLRAGTGLRGLQERVHSVGGRLIVSERAPHGTRVEAILPCGS